MRRLVPIVTAAAVTVAARPASLAPSAPPVAAPATPVPTTFVAVRGNGGRLVVVDTSTGEDQRVLFDFGSPPPDLETVPQGVDGLDVSPDGATAYFSVGPEPASGVLYRVPVAGGRAEQLGWGMRPRVSPDGRRLAYIALQTVVVRDLATGTERRLEMDPDDEIADPAAVEWLADSRHLLLEAQWRNTPRVLDADTAAHQSDGRLLGPGPVHGEYWLAGVRATDGFVGVLIALYPPQSDAAQPARTFAVLDPATGAEKGRLDLPFPAVDAVYDASGRHQLFVAEDGSVHRRSGGGFTEIPGAGATLVAW